jgi:hypothetical protein
MQSCKIIQEDAIIIAVQVGCGVFAAGRMHLLHARRRRVQPLKSSAIQQRCNIHSILKSVHVIIFLSINSPVYFPMNYQYITLSLNSSTKVIGSMLSFSILICNFYRKKSSMFFFMCTNKGLSDEI